MAIYFEDKEITNIDNLVPQIGLDITDIWFGDTNVYTVWQVYEGTLPATLNASGADMRQYQVYGAAGGVGDKTVQLFDKNATDTSNGYAVNRGLYSGGATANVNGWNISEYIPISANQDYVFKNLYGNSAAFCIYDSSKQYIWGEAYENRTTLTFNSGNNASYIRFNIRVNTNMDTLMLTPGTSPPETFVPFGHKLPMVVFGGYQIYDDVLPAQISANGMDFKNYRLFGATGGVGDRTVQLFDYTKLSQNEKIDNNGYVTYISSWGVSDYINVNPNTTYTAKGITSGGNLTACHIAIYDSNKQILNLIQIDTTNPITVNVPEEGAFVRLSVRYVENEASTTAMFTKGTTPPENYVPYGYEVDISTEKPIIYGFHINPNDPNSNTAVTYLADAVGKTPAAMGSTAFSYGDWANTFFMPRPCMLKYDGTVDYYLNPNDYSQKADGTASDYNNLTYGGNAMMEFPLIWYKFVQGAESGEGYFYCSNRKVDDSYKCFSNLDCDGNIIEHFYMPIYNGCTYDGKMRSISGLQLLPWSTTAYSSSSTYAVGSKVNYQDKMWKCTTAVEAAEAFDPAKWEQFAFNGQTSGTEEITQATANNTTAKVEWYTNVLCDRQLINALLVLLSKSLDTQGSFGRGIDSGGKAAKEAYVTGSLDDKGLFYGATANGNDAVKVFGMENWWACASHRTAGLVGTANNTYLYKMAYSTADESTANGYNTDGTGYLSIGNKPATNYIKKMQYGLWGCLPTETGSYSTQYWKDYYYNGTGYALCGGHADNNTGAGAFYAYLNFVAEIRNWNLSSDLSCKPCRVGNLSKNLEAATVTPIYIGNTALQKDEYIDYEAGKVYRRTENELNNRLITNNYPGTSLGNIQLSVKPNTPYTLKTNCPRYDNGALICLDIKRSGSTTSDNGAWDGQTRTITSTSDGVLYVRYRGNNSEYDLTSYSYMLTEGTTPPETYVPYLTPTDPPVALPALPTAEGEMIVDYAGQSIVPSSFYGKYINNPILPIYIGDTALQKDEYVDYKEQKVYRRTAQLIDAYRRGATSSTIGNTRVTSIHYILATGSKISAKLYDTTQNLRFAFVGFNEAGAAEWDATQTGSVSNRTYDSGYQTAPFECTDTASYMYVIIVSYTDDRVINPEDVYGKIGIVYGSIEDIPPTYTPYLKPTNPPVALPALPTYDGETIADYVGQSVTIPEKVAFKYRKKNF